MGVPLERFWKTVNPLIRPLAGFAPWWVLLETTGHRTGARRRTPLVNGPLDGSVLSVLSVYGDSAVFVKNIRANPRVRVKRRGRWREGTVEVIEVTSETVADLGLYARRVLLRIASDPKVVRVTIS
jgi:deazaflavin-dependent oxidoreductase (nitroreductase family)